LLTWRIVELRIDAIDPSSACRSRGELSFTLMSGSVRIIEKPDLSDAVLNDLFSASWTSHTVRAFGPILQRSLTYLGAYQDSELVGFVNVAWDGGDHAFLLDPTVLPSCRRRGIGLALVAAAVKATAASGAEWLHVDYDAALDPFYRRAGFRPTHAGLIHLSASRMSRPDDDDDD
jgi:GNAT superfamily N-acetyltransferase